MVINTVEKSEYTYIIQMEWNFHRLLKQRITISLMQS